MHEATLAENVLSIAVEAARQNHADKIFRVGLRLGDMAGVEVEALRMAFDVLKKFSPAADAELVIERVPVTAECNGCGKIFRLERYNFFCPECDGVLILRGGRELQVDFVDCE